MSVSRKVTIPSGSSRGLAGVTPSLMTSPPFATHAANLGCCQLRPSFRGNKDRGSDRGPTPAGCLTYVIIRLIIQTIRQDPFGAVWTDEAPNMSRLDPSGAVQIDAEHSTRNRKVKGSSVAVGPIGQ